MTSPVETIRVRCPRCGTESEVPRRPPAFACGECGHFVEFEPVAVEAARKPKGKR